MTWLLSPVAWLLLALVLALSAWPVGRFRTVLCAVSGVIAVVACAAMTPVVANALVVPLEQPMNSPQSCIENPPSIAVVLGGGIDRWPSDNAEDFSMLNLTSRRRVDVAVEWRRRGAGRNLVLVGGATHGARPSISALMAAYARASGVPSGNLRVESKSDDTWENARMSARLQPPLPKRIVLVTSAMHMPRARMAFASAGFEVCPVTGDSRRLPSRLPWALVPRSSALVRTEAALHELVGIGYYRWRAKRLAQRGLGQ